MSLLAGLCAAGFARTLGRRRGALAALAAISLYTLLVGAQAAVIPVVTAPSGQALDMGEGAAPLLADSGYALLNSANWVANLNPQVVLLSTPIQNPDGLAEALQGAALLSTAQNGWIELSTDGEKMWVEVGK